LLCQLHSIPLRVSICLLHTPFLSACYILNILYGVGKVFYTALQTSERALWGRKRLPEAPAVIAFIGSETLPNLWGRKRFLLPVSYFPTIWGRKRFVPFVTYFPTNRVGNASFYRLHTFPRIFYILSDEFSSETLPSTCKTLPSAFISIPVTRRLALPSACYIFSPNAIYFFL